MIISEIIIVILFITSVVFTGKFVVNQLKERCFTCDYSCPVKQLKQEIN